MNLDRKFYVIIFQKQKDMEILLKQTLLFTEDNAIYSPEDSLANLTVFQVKEKGKRMNATCGPKCLEQLGRFSRPTLWVKMLAASLIGMGDWYSMRCKLTWKLRGTKCSRMYFQLVPKMLHTDGIEFGLLPTPTTQEPTTEAELTPNGRRKTKDGKDSHSLNIGRMAAMGLLKTPTRMDGEVSSGKKNPVSGNSGTLAQEIMSNYKPTMEKLGIYATPRARDWKGKNNGTQRGRGNDIGQDIYEQTGMNGQLNPQFVEEMMGFPENWTLLPFLNGEQKV